MTFSIRPDAALFDRVSRDEALPAAVRAGFADPLARLSVVTVTRDAVRQLGCYRLVETRERLVAVTPRGGETEVSLVDTRLPEAMIADVLGLDAPLVDLGHKYDLDTAAIWALAALADAHRQHELECLLARAPSRLAGVDADAVHLRALDGAVMPDPRWLSGLLSQLMGAGDVTEASLDAGLATLARAGIVIEQDGLWSVQPDFAAAFAHLQVPLAGARLCIDLRRNAARTTVVFVRSIAVVWVVESPGDDALTLRACDGSSARRLLHDALARSLTDPSPAVDPERLCARCGQVAATTDRFCGRCGARLA